MYNSCTRVPGSWVLSCAVLALLCYKGSLALASTAVTRMTHPNCRNTRDAEGRLAGQEQTPSSYHLGRVISGSALDDRATPNADLDNARAQPVEMKHTRLSVSGVRLEVEGQVIEGSTEQGTNVAQHVSIVLV